MKFVIEHLSKSFEKKEVLRDIDFTFDDSLSAFSRKIWAARQKRRWKNNAV